MYELWEIKNGTNNLIYSNRDEQIARTRAIEESNLRGNVIAVVRQGFGVPLYFAYRGVLSDGMEAIRRLTQPKPPAPPVEVPEDEQSVSVLPSRRRAKPSETKTKQQGPTSYKEFPASVTEIDAEQFTISALVNIFGIEDDGGDIVHAGAFSKTLAENGSRIKFLDSHQNRSTLNIVGKILEIREVGRESLSPELLLKWPEATGGLFVKAKMLTSTPEGLGIYERIRNGLVSEYSIGFDVLDSDNERVFDPVTKKARIVRNIRQIRLWEVSCVPWGMNPATSTVSVKNNSSGETPQTNDEAVDGEQDSKEYTPQGPIMRLGDSLVGRIMDPLDFTLNMWLIEGKLVLEEYALIKEIAAKHISMIRDELPDTLSLRDLTPMMMWSGDGPDSTKVGRVLSERNYGKIKQACDLLTEVMSGAGMTDEDDTANADKSAHTEHEHDGPSGSPQAPTSPEAGPPENETPATKQAALLEKLKQRLADVEAESHDYERESRTL